VAKRNTSAPQEPSDVPTGTTDAPDASDTSLTGLSDLHSRLSDQYWRLNNLYWIRDADGNKVKFHMNAVQRHAYSNRWHRTVNPKSRQHGLSTLWILFCLDVCLFNHNKTCGVIDRTDADGQKKLDKAKFAYDHLDDPDDPATSELGKLIKASIVLTKSNANELRFSNDSSYWASVTFRGGTVQVLHISELGPVAHTDPRRAEEIKTGAFPSVHGKGIIIIESTHKGGRSGMFYDFICKARNRPEVFTNADWKLLFYGWNEDPRNVIDDTRFPYWTPTPPEREFFEQVEKQGIKLSRGQKLWWSRKKGEMGDFMSTEYPTTIDEMLDSVIKGSVYGPILNQLREQGRLTEFPIDSTAPLYTSWDLGNSDLTVIFLWQFSGPYPLLVDCYASCRAHPSRYVEVVNEWEHLYGTKTAANFLPHDGAPAGGSGPSWKGELERCGLKNIRIVPRTPDVWIGINHGRRLLPMCMIHVKNLTRPQAEVEGTPIPVALEALEAYRVEPVPDGRGMKEMPVHDINSHYADAFRTMAEALARGMLRGKSAIERTFRNSAEDSNLLSSQDNPFAEPRRKSAICGVHAGGLRKRVHV
jgi:hypothetical protein